jgi:hypothetical protein
VNVVAVLDSERIKLTTTRAPLWSAVAVVVLSLGVTAMLSAASGEYNRLTPQDAVLGVAVFGVPVLMILASLTVTGEYRSGLIRSTFLAVPQRTWVLVAKAVLSSVFSGGCAALTAIAAIVIAGLSLADGQTWRMIGAVTLYAMLAAVLGVAVGALVRYAAGAVAVLLMWPLVLEPILGNMPNVGRQIGAYLPFANMYEFLGVAWLFPAYTVPWGHLGAVLYFTAVVAAVFVAAVVVLNRRDA